MQTLEMILTLLGGLGVFLIALKIMSETLESIAGNKLKDVFNKISSNRFAGIAVGAGVTAVIQSSSATTVMVVGFVNAGVMTLRQATAIIMGANIGTTITAQIVALQFLPITAFFGALSCVGAFMMKRQDRPRRSIVGQHRYDLRRARSDERVDAKFQRLRGGPQRDRGGEQPLPPAAHRTCDHRDHSKFFGDDEHLDHDGASKARFSSPSASTSAPA